jgi:hypothetical protein
VRAGGLSLFVVLGGALAAPAAAQIMQPHPLPDSVCGPLVARERDVGRPTAASDSLQYCGAPGFALIADLIIRSAADTDSYSLNRVRGASLIQDAGVLAAAVSLAVDRSATVASRINGFRIVVRQLRGPESWWDIAGHRQPEQLTDSLASCAVVHVEGVVGIANATPIPADADRTIASASERVARDPSEPAVVRNVARCLRNSLGPHMLPAIDARQVRLEAVCGKTMRVHSDVPIHLTLEWRVRGTPEHGYIAGNTGGNTHFVTGHGGLVDLIYDGRVVDSARTSGAPCPPPEAGTARSPVVPVVAPDSEPGYLYADSSRTRDDRWPGAPFVRDVVLLRFTQHATQQERQAAVEEIHGTVIGGYPFPRPPQEGMYLIRLPRDPTNDRLFAAIAALKQLPQVDFAIPNQIFVGTGG